MIPPASVQAQVADLRSPKIALPAQLVVDANVLYWVFYPNFSGLQFAGGRPPLPYQLREYTKAWKRASQSGTTFFAVPAILGEFARVSEYAEFEALWLTDPNQPQPDPKNPQTKFSPYLCKFARYHYSGQLASIRTTIEQILGPVLKTVQFLSQFPSPADQHHHALQEWLASAGDFSDAIMVASAMHNRIPHILSDDIDLATFPGITLYTANQRAIDAARLAGKLL